MKKTNTIMQGTDKGSLTKETEVDLQWTMWDDEEENLRIERLQLQVEKTKLGDGANKGSDKEGESNEMEFNDEIRNESNEVQFVGNKKKEEKFDTTSLQDI